MSARPYWLTSMLAVLLLSLNAIAQSGTAQPSGFVKDESGAVVTRAAVNVTNESRAADFPDTVPPTRMAIT